MSQAASARSVIGAALMLVLLALAPALAQEPRPANGASPIPPGTEIGVATRMLAPFVIKEGAELSGFSVDLWHAIALELGLKTRFVTYETLPELLDAVSAGREGAGIAAISITSERGERLDFSQPMFRSGLSIMVPTAAQKLDMLSIMFSSEMLNAVAIFLLVLILPAHVIWFLARGRDDGLPIAERYFPGIFDAIFWCAESMGGAAQGHPRRHFARIAAIVWIYAGIVLIAYFTAFATTSLTMQSLRGEIDGPGDLRAKQVAVVEGSTSAAHAAELGAITRSFKDFSSAAQAVIAERAEAAVYDTPIIMHYVKDEPRAQIAGAQFRPESYGIIFPVGSPLRRPVDQALLKLLENGTYESLYRKWFGQSEGGG